MSKTTTPDMLGPADVCERLGIGRKPLYRSADLDSWVDSMPQEAPTRRSA